MNLRASAISRLLAALTLACLSVSALAQSSSQSADSAHAQAAVAALQQWYVPQDGLYWTTGWWNAANAITALANYSRVSHSTEYLPVFANTLHAGYGECTRITAQGPYVHAIEVTVEPDGFLVRREGAGVVAQHKKMVRGIALKSTILPLDQWVDLLTKALARQAGSNARAAWVLARLTGNDHTRVR